jgi:hypothetical protein
MISAAPQRRILGDGSDWDRRIELFWTQDNWTDRVMRDNRSPGCRDEMRLKRTTRLQDGRHAFSRS